MNEHISWGKIGVLVVAIVGVGAIAFMIGKKSDEVVTPAPVVSTPAQGSMEKKIREQKEMTKTPTVNKDGYEEHTERIYVNKSFGFTLKMPESWGKYFVKIRDSYPDDGTKIVEFALPLVSAKTNLDQYTVTYVSVVPIGTWRKDMCKDLPDEPCFQGEEAGRNSRYVFEWGQRSIEALSDCENNDEFRKTQVYFCAENDKLPSDLTPIQ